MGLAFSAKGFDETPRWSYSGFARFREKLAASIGLDINEMQGFRKEHPTDKGYYKIGTRKWNDIKSPLKFFLNHSDCEGKLTASQCNLIAPILKVIIVLWEEDDEIDNYMGFLLIAAMEHCAANNTPLIFC